MTESEESLGGLLISLVGGQIQGAELADLTVHSSAALLTRDCEVRGWSISGHDSVSGTIRIRAFSDHAQSVWEGHITEPKTRKSKAPIPIIRPLARMLEAHRTRTASARNIPLPTEGPIFVSEAGTPLNLNNVLNRQILPVLNRCETCHKPKGECKGPAHKYQRDSSLPEWKGWHAFRRGLGTNLQGLGVDLKTTMEILRHAQISTTANFYVKEVSEQSKTAMDRFEQEINFADSTSTILH